MRNKKLVKIDIDLLTQCLIRKKDDKIVKTEIKEIIVQDYNLKDWEFNWIEESKKGNKILGLFAENDRRLQGIIEYYETIYSIIANGVNHTCTIFCSKHCRTSN